MFKYVQITVCLVALCVTRGVECVLGVVLCGIVHSLLGEEEVQVQGP